jgi:antitoxin ParD1/3/4
MPGTVEKISIALPPEMATLLREAVVSGEYSSASEVVREALRAWTRKRKLEALELNELRRLVRQGMESGPGIDAGSAFSRLRSKYAPVRRPK